MVKKDIPVIGFRVSEWEAALDNNPNIRFEEMRIRNAHVHEVRGVVISEKKEYPVRWDYNGHCFYGSRRATRHDIIFPKPCA